MAHGQAIPPPLAPAHSQSFNHESWCQKVVGGHLSLLDELINYPKAKRQHDLLAQTTMPTTRLRPAAILPPPSTVFTRAHCRRT
eukprot:scaffold1655_cov89-Skeletonema_dohrnii-CCMP3373.AAC.1